MAKQKIIRDGLVEWGILKHHTQAAGGTPPRIQHVCMLTEYQKLPFDAPDNFGDDAFRICS